MLGQSGCDGWDLKLAPRTQNEEFNFGFGSTYFSQKQWRMITVHNRVGMRRTSLCGMQIQDGYANNINPPPLVTEGQPMLTNDHSGLINRTSQPFCSAGNLRNGGSWPMIFSVLGSGQNSARKTNNFRKHPPL